MPGTNVKRGFKIKTTAGKIRIGKNATKAVSTNEAGDKVVTYTTAKGKTLTKTVSATKPGATATDPRVKANKTRTGKGMTKTQGEVTSTGRTNTFAKDGGRQVVKTWSWPDRSVTPDPEPEPET